jgi:beta-mannosidase
MTAPTLLPGVAPLSLAGRWDAWLGDATDALAGRPAPRTVELPANWWLRGIDHAGRATFARDLEIGPELADRRLRLRFGGVDYRCRVWLDGVELGRHEGYFEPFWFDLPGLAAGRHRLVVEVDSPNEPWGSVWHMRKTLIKGVLGHHDARPGNAWSREGQARNSGGIWGPVTLEAWPSAVIVDELLVRALPAGDAADVELVATLAAAAGSPPVVGLRLALVGPRDRGELTTSVELPAAGGRVEVRATARLPLADRWTTWDRGEPVRYDATLTVHDAADPAAAPLAVASRRTGIRSVEVDRSFRWHLNGEELWVRGTNYIGTFWPAEYDEALVRRDLGLMRDAGLNQVRVHAHVAAPILYEVADELGISIWQDFPLQWGYSDEPAFHAEAHRQLRAMVRGLGSHPSIVAWCCHNESPWDAPWMAEETGGAYDPSHNRELDAALEGIARAEDPTRYVHRNSGTGDGHFYAGWYFGRWEDFAYRPGGPFVTEYGSLAPPDVATLREIIPADALAYDTPRARRTWAFHDFQHRETRTHVRVLPSDGLERFVAASQAYQANLLQVATESYRRGKAARPGGLPADGGPLITGIQQFMAVEGWESMTWAVLDHHRRPKPGYEALRRAMAPRLVSLELRDGRGHPAPRPRAGRPIGARAWLINDLRDPVPSGTLTWTVRPIADPRLPAAASTAAGTTTAGTTPTAPVASGELAVAGAPGDSATILGETEFRLAAGWYRVELRLVDEAGGELAANRLDVEVRR